MIPLWCHKRGSQHGTKCSWSSLTSLVVLPVRSVVAATIPIANIRPPQGSHGQYPRLASPHQENRSKPATTWKSQEVRVGDEPTKAVCEFIIEDRLEAGWHRNIVANRPGSDATMLIFCQQPGDIELGSVGMRCVLKNRRGQIGNGSTVEIAISIG